MRKKKIILLIIVFVIPVFFSIVVYSAGNDNLSNETENIIASEIKEKIFEIEVIGINESFSSIEFL